MTQCVQHAQQVRGGGGATFGIVVSATYKAHPQMSFGVVPFLAIGNRILGLNDTRTIVTALAAIAPSLGDLGVGGVFSTFSNRPGASGLFILPGGNETSIAKGEFTSRAFAGWTIDSSDSFFRMQTKQPHYFGKV